MIQETPSVRARALSGMVTNEKETVTANVALEILEGPDTGQRITYRGLVTAKSMPYVTKDLKAVGWKGRSFGTLAADVESTHATTTIEIQHRQTKDGNRTFPIVRSMGEGNAKKPDVPATANDITNADMLLESLGLNEQEPMAADDDSIPF